MSRESNVPCPNCGKLLFHPEHGDDHHDWDCTRCGLEVPATTQIKGIDVIEAYRSVELREAIQKLLPKITFIDLLRRELRTEEPTQPQQKAEPMSQQTKVRLVPVLRFDVYAPDGTKLAEMQPAQVWKDLLCLQDAEGRELVVDHVSGLEYIHNVCVDHYDDAAVLKGSPSLVEEIERHKVPAPN